MVDFLDLLLNKGRCTLLYNQYTGYMPNRYAMPPQQQMQQMPPQQMMQQQFQQMPQQPMMGLKGRLVSSLDEVKASVVDMDGSETYFPHPASNSIFTKCIDMQGNSVIKHYVLEDVKDSKLDPVKEELDKLNKRVNDLEEMLNSLTGGNVEDKKKK